MITRKQTLSYFQVLCNGPEDAFQEEGGHRVMQRMQSSRGCPGAHMESVRTKAQQRDNGDRGH